MKYRFLRPLLSMIFLLALALFVPPAAVIDALRGLDPRFIPLVLALNLPLLGTKILRWGWLVRAEASQVGWGAVARSYLLGLGLSLITPSGTGEVGRAAFLPPDAPRLALTGKALLDKLIDVGVLAVLGAFGLLISGERGAQVAGFVLLGLAGGGASLLYAPRPAFLPQRLLAVWEKVAGVPPRLFIRLVLTAGLGFGGAGVGGGAGFGALRPRRGARFKRHPQPFCYDDSLARVGGLGLGQSFPQKGRGLGFCLGNGQA